MRIVEKARLLTSKDDIRSIFIQLVATLLLFTALRWLYFNFSRLGGNSYFNESISLELLRNYRPVIILLVINALLIVNYKKLRWTAGRQDRAVKVFLFIISITLAWSFSTYDFNLYFNQGHNIDRILLLIIPFLIFIHPLFIAPFIVLSIAVTAQFEFPLHLFSWTDKKVLYYSLILFNTCLYTRLLFNKDHKPFIILLLILIGCNYFYAAYAKIIINWIFHNELHNLFISSYVNGWLGHLDEAYILGLASEIKKFNTILLFITFIIELGALIMFRSKTTCIIVLILFSFLHVGIFMSSGIFFWKWIVLDLAAVLLVMGLTGRDKAYIFNRKMLLISIILMIISIPFFKPTRLGWYDTNLNNIYIFLATGESGKKYLLHTNFFSPYDFPFTQNRFYFLSSENLLVRTYGSTEDYEILKGIKEIESLRELNQLESNMGRNYYDTERIDAFREFLSRYFKNLNSRGDKSSVLSSLAAPKHKLTFPRSGGYEPGDRIVRVDVLSKKVIYKDNDILELETRPVLSVCIIDNKCE